MAGDYSRFRFNPRKRFSRLYEQQGRVRLDAEANELMELVARRLETTSNDVFGHCAAPRATTPNAFLVGFIAGTPPNLSLGEGRYYVDGLQVEHFGGENRTYRNQPFLSFDANGAPSGAVPPELNSFPGTVLVYLDVFQREVTYLEDPALLEVALNGVDTTTRSQTVWQVKLYGGTGPNNTPPSCSTDLDAVFPPSGGRLSSQGNQPPASTDPCVLPETPGFRGIENRLYRVEIHTGGSLSTARWKWSRDNGSIVTRVEAIATAANSTLTVRRIGRDSVLRFNDLDWVEIIDDRLELWGQPGFMAQVSHADQATRTLLLDRPIPANLFNPTDLERHTRVRRWDQKNGVDANGLLPITSGFMPLEEGVEVELTLATTTGASFHVADYWSFHARSIDAGVFHLNAAPPFAIQHHYCPLATITGTASAAPVPNDCRTLWPPLAEAGDGCECTICVTPELHASGEMTIQRAIDEVRERGGGKVCLDVGEYVLDEPLNLSESHDLTLRGRNSTLIHNGGGAALVATTVVRLKVESLLIQMGETGLHLESTNDVEIRECRFEGGERARGTAIELAGFIRDTTISECELHASVGIGAASGADTKMLVTIDLKIIDNLIEGDDVGIALGGTVFEEQSLVIAHARALVARNIVASSARGIDLSGTDTEGSSVDIEDNYVAMDGSGILVGARVIGVRRNLVDGQENPNQALRVTPAGIGLAALEGANAWVEDNFIGVPAGFGIVLQGPFGDVTIESNVITEAGLGGIVTNKATAVVIGVARNRIEQIGGASISRIRGIGLDLCQTVQVEENVVRQIAPAIGSQAQSCAAIDLVACTSAIISSNRISGVGPAQQRGIPAAGIEVLGTVQDTTIADNVVQHQEDTSAVNGIALFNAILLRATNFAGDPARPNLRLDERFIRTNVDQKKAAEQGQLILTQAKEAQLASAQDKQAQEKLTDQEKRALEKQLEKEKLEKEKLEKLQKEQLEKLAKEQGGQLAVAAAAPARAATAANPSRVITYAPQKSFVFTDRAIAFIAARIASAGIQGNTCYAVDSGLPAIDAETNGPLVVANNRVDQASIAGSPTGGPLASTSLRAASPAVSAGHNIVRTETRPAISIEGAKFTVLGNLVSTEINANGFPITAPWDVLNERGI